MNGLIRKFRMVPLFARLERGIDVTHRRRGANSRSGSEGEGGGEGAEGLLVVADVPGAEEVGGGCVVEAELFADPGNAEAFSVTP